MSVPILQPIIHCIGGPCDGAILEFNPETMTVLGSFVKITYRPVRSISSQDGMDLPYITTGYSSDDKISVVCLYRVAYWVLGKDTYYFLYHEKENPQTAILWALRNYKGSGEPIPMVERLKKDVTPTELFYPTQDYPYPTCVKNPSAPSVPVDLDARNIDISKL